MKFSNFHKLVAGTRLDPLSEFLEQDYIEHLNNGTLQRWLETIDSAPFVEEATVDLEAQVSIGCASALTASQTAALLESLKALIPWRKGPIEIFGTKIDTEWKSDAKWDRVVPHIHSLKDRLVLDVGSGNGYYSLRMLGAGARQVIGLDPHLAYVVQFWLLKRYLEDYPVDVLPIGLEQLPSNLVSFDTTFSMGVLYHRRSPIDHLEQLKQTLTPGGQLVLETIIVEGGLGYSLTPQGRYAGMGNVWFVPSIPTVVSWLQKVGFVEIQVVDVSTTSCDEQRCTEWMPFRSLKDSLDPIDPSQTIEGHPAPMRAVIVASKKG